MTEHDYWLSIVLPVVGILGAVTGRFLCRCIEEFPKHEKLLDQLRAVGKPLQYCQGCNARPSFPDKLPLVGAIVTRGRCRSCQRKLPRVVPVIELITALLFMAFYWREIPGDGLLSSGGLTSHEGPPGPEMLTTPWAPATWLHVRYLLHMVMVCGLIVATEIDRRLRIIPDGCTVPIMVIAVLASAVGAQLYVVPIWFQDASTANIVRQVMPEIAQPFFQPWDPQSLIREWPRLHGLLVSVLGLIIGGSAVWTVRLVGFLALKQEAMGFGDVVLMAMVGSVVGWQPALAVFMLGAPLLAVFFALANWLLHSDNQIPYGPFLSAATILLLLTWPWSWPYPKRFLDMGPLLIPMAVTAVLSLGAMLYIVRALKEFFGFAGPPDDSQDDWRSADHLFYYNGERPDEDTGQWPRDVWPGSRSGRGLRRYRDWRHGE